MRGDVSKITGKISMLYGDVTGISGDITGVRGVCTGLVGSLDECSIQDRDRTEGLEISHLIRS